jgi:hypothetical protein
MSTHTPAAGTAPADILIERREGVAIVTLNRPRERNPLGLDFPDQMLGVLQQLDDDLGLHAVVLTGAGNVFCAGAELGQVVNPDGVDAELQFRFIRGLHKVVQRIRELELPVIAAVNGAAVGGGAALAMACDIAVASDKARYFFAFGRLGAAACDMGCSYLLPRIVGSVRAPALAAHRHQRRGRGRARRGPLRRRRSRRTPAGRGTGHRRVDQAGDTTPRRSGQQAGHRPRRGHRPAVLPELRGLCAELPLLHRRPQEQAARADGTAEAQVGSVQAGRPSFSRRSAAPRPRR